MSPREVTTPEELAEEGPVELSLRPQRLAEFIGQQKVKDSLRIYIDAALSRREPLDHTLFFGPPGLGKTTLAELIARELGVNIRTTSGPALEKPGDLVGTLTNLRAGDILFIEATAVRGKGKLSLTGQLGEVMKESAQAALTLVKARAESLGIDPARFEKTDIHMHIPAGAIPKDGPSAGVAMFVALASLALDKPVRHDLAMTGEISLRGLVLPVGGIKEKVLAALQAGIRTVMLPARNRRDLEDIPDAAQKRLQFVWLERVDDALNTAIAADGLASAA